MLDLLICLGFTLGRICIVAANRVVVGMGLVSILCYQCVNVFVSSRLLVELMIIYCLFGVKKYIFFYFDFYA